MTEAVFPPLTGLPLFGETEAAAPPECASECVICARCGAELEPWRAVPVVVAA